MKPASGRSPADALEGLTKMIREFSRDIEQLELARNEDNATIRELEIGVLKGNQCLAGEGALSADVLFTLLV